MAVYLYLFLAISSGLGLLGKAQLVKRIIPLPFPVVYSIVLIWIFLPLSFSFALRYRRFIAPLVLLGLVCASLFIYPRMQGLQKAGRGTDQPDCVIVAAKGMASAKWPYDTSQLWTHDPMSCGPGWVALQTPVIIAAGYRWNLIALWALAILLLLSRLDYDTLAGVLTLLGLAAVTWVTASDGTDFLPFGILLAALFLVLQTPSRFHLLFLILAALVVQFRFPMLILPVLFLPRKRLLQGIIVSVVAFCSNLVFLLWRPEAYISGGPLHLFLKLTHTHLLALGRASASIEVSLVFILMLCISIFVRRRVTTSWIAFAYLLALTLIPAGIDLIQKCRLYPSLLGGLGIWEGANWISGCVPLATLLLLTVQRQSDAESGITNPPINYSAV